MKGTAKLKTAMTDANLQILKVLKRNGKGMTIGEIAEHTGKSHSDTSQRITELYLCYLIKKKRKGKYIYCSIDKIGVKRMLDSISNELL